MKRWKRYSWIGSGESRLFPLYLFGSALCNVCDIFDFSHMFFYFCHVEENGCASVPSEPKCSMWLQLNSFCRRFCLPRTCSAAILVYTILDWMMIWFCWISLATQVQRILKENSLHIHLKHRAGVASVFDFSIYSSLHLFFQSSSCTIATLPWLEALQQSTQVFCVVCSRSSRHWDMNQILSWVLEFPPTHKPIYMNSKTIWTCKRALRAVLI